MKTLRLLLLCPLAWTLVAHAAPDPQAPPGTWVRGSDEAPPWAEDELRGIQREVENRLDFDRFPQALVPRPDQQERLDALRADAQAQILEQVQAARDELLEVWKQALTQDQWTGFEKLPALHQRGPQELREILLLSGEQVQAMKQAQNQAAKRLKRWRLDRFRHKLTERGREIFEPVQLVRLDTWKRLDREATARQRRVQQLLGDGVATVIAPHVEQVVQAQREEAWDRFELLERLQAAAEDTPDAQLLEQFRARQAERDARVAEAQATLRELSEPQDAARLVGLDLLPN
ncbi:MAG: hypothetical protein R3F62_06555 [Planctomycetota bacterium]